MRLFFIGWGDDIKELVDVVKKIKEQGHEIVYWTRCSDNMKIDTSKFPGTIFHDYHDALAVRPPPELKNYNFPPVGENIIKDLSEAESIVLTMMIKKFDFLSLMERKVFYYDLLKYWYGVVMKFKPDVIIFPAAPHTVYDYVIYSVAKYLNIKVILFDFTRIDDRLLINNDFVLGNIKLSDKSNLNDVNYSLSDLEDDIKQYYLKYTKKNTDVTPPDVKPILDSYKGYNLLRLKIRVLWKSILDISVFKKIIFSLYKKFSSNLKKEYLSVMSKVDYEKKFIFLPLHYQPECSTSTLGGVFVNQIQMIEILSHCLPKDWIIYVKEHPMQWGPRGYNFFGYRYKGYYKKIKAIKNVYLISVDTDQFRLIDRCQLVATVTGTTGWEAILRHKPVFYFGFPWYKNCPGSTRIFDVISCKEAFEKINNGNNVQQQQIINYLYKFGKNSLRGYLDFYVKSISSLTPEQNRDNIFNSIIKELEKS